MGKRPTGHALLLGAMLLVLLTTATAAAQEGLPVEVPASPASSGDVVPIDAADPSVPDVPDDGGDAPRVETPPVAKDERIDYEVPGGFPLLIALVVAVGVVSTYAPGGIRRMRIEAAWRVSNLGRLALARGEFAAALTAFDRAIDEAHAAYTRRNGSSGGRDVEWALTPDAFYIGLWRGRAAALRGMGRSRAAEFTEALASELENVVAPST